jgi:hypothetical protein
VKLEIFEDRLAHRPHPIAKATSTGCFPVRDLTRSLWTPKNTWMTAAELNEVLNRPRVRHYVLHKKLYEDIRITSIDDRIQFVIHSEDQYSNGTAGIRIRGTTLPLDRLEA